MKKTFIALSAAVMLLSSSPASKAASFAHPIEMRSGTPATSANKTFTTTENTEAVSVTKTIKAKKATFFSKIKKLLGFGGGKSQIVAALLAIFLGSIGVHRFYLGYTWHGVAHIVLVGLGLGLYLAGIAALVSSATITIPTLSIVGLALIIANNIWVFVDFIRILIGSLEPKEGFYN